METDTVFFGIWWGDKLAAVSLAEMDIPAKNVEMGGFATLHEYRGRSLSTVLLETMDKAMPSYEMKATHGTTRSCSPSMNITFARMGYSYAGRLINNTNIGGGIESLNVWYKHL